MRQASTEYITEAAKRIGPVYCLFLFADFGATAGIFALWNGLGIKKWRGQDYNSGLNFVSVEGGSENADGTTEPMNFSIGWKDQATHKDFVKDALNARTGGIAFVAQGFMSDTGDIISEPIYRWYGRVGVPKIVESARVQDGGSTIYVSCTAEETRSDRDRPLKFRITHASQLAFDPTDKGLEYQPGLSAEDLLWGDLYYKERHSP